MLSMILRDRGASVICARDYTEALRCLEESPTDLLVSDIGLPGKDGYDLIREVRRREGSSLQRLPAIALTAFARPEDRNIAFAAGFDAHCAKPLHPNELMSAILSVGAQERG
jgi:CheY-like chemotaxis protein